MNQYILIRRLRGPAILLLIGVIALLRTSGVIHGFWHLFFPLLLILLGVLLLAERAALAAEGGYPVWPFGGSPNSATGTGVPPNQPQSTSIIPASTHDYDRDFGKDHEGGER
jgi:hypothetical protein